MRHIRLSNKQRSTTLKAEINKYLFKRKHFDNTVLIDGDIIVYRCGFAAEKAQYHLWDKNGVFLGTFQYKREMNEFVKSLEEGWTFEKEIKVDNLANTLHSVKITVDSIIERCQAGYVRVFLTGSGNFREKVATTQTYKGTRPDAKPKWYDEIKRYLRSGYGAVTAEGIEADDLMGIEARKNTEKNVIASLDKDLDVVPGWHYNWVKDELYWVDEISALRNFWSQMITGDTIDNIAGIRGKGEKYAEKLLGEVDDPKKMEQLVYQEYQKAFGDNADHRFEENKQLLWILQDEQDIPEI